MSNRRIEMNTIAKQSYEFVKFNSFSEINRFLFVDHDYDSGDVTVRMLYKGFVYEVVGCDDALVTLEIHVKDWADDAHPRYIEFTDEDVAGGGDAGIEHFMGCVRSTSGQTIDLGYYGWGEFVNGTIMYRHDDRGLSQASRNAHELNEAKLWMEWDGENENDK